MFYTKTKMRGLNMRIDIVCNNTNVHTCMCFPERGQKAKPYTSQGCPTYLDYPNYTICISTQTSHKTCTQVPNTQLCTCHGHISFSCNVDSIHLQHNIMKERALNDNASSKCMALNLQLALLVSRHHLAQTSTKSSKGHNCLFMGKSNTQNYYYSTKHYHHINQNQE